MPVDQIRNDGSPAAIAMHPGAGVVAVSAVAESPSSLAIAVRTEQSVTVLTVDGVLDSGSSAALRDSVMKATLHEPFAVMVDVNALQVPAQSAWSAFLGARWQAETQHDRNVVLGFGLPARTEEGRP